MNTDEKIVATLNAIRFHENRFLIGMFSTVKGKTVCCLGNMLNPQIGITYVLWGKWTTHETFGKQFQFGRYQTKQPDEETGTKGIYIYLVRHAKDVGPTIADRLIDTYGVDTLAKIKEKPEQVAAEIRGLTLRRVEAIRETLLENEEIEAVMVKLTEMLNVPGMRKSMPVDLIDKYGSDAIEELNQNPYILCEFPGTGFVMADRFAMRQKNFLPDSIFRQMAAIRYAMQQDLHNGNTWVSCGQLNNTVAMEIIGVAATDGLAAMERDAEIVIKTKDDIRYCCLAEVDADETLIADKFKNGVCYL